jgi:hypothetical protein
MKVDRSFETIARAGVGPDVIIGRIRPDAGPGSGVPVPQSRRAGR